MTRVFISYSSKDREAADYIAEFLQKNSISVFIDYQRLVGGDNFVGRLGSEIDASDCVVFVLSSNSIASKWVQAEISWAFNQNKRIIPVALERDVPLLQFFFLSSLHQINFTHWYSDKTINPQILRQLLESVGGTSTVTSTQTSYDLEVIRTWLGVSLGNYIKSLAFSPDGSLLASCGTSTISALSIKIWDVSALGEKLVRQLEQVDGISFMFAPNGNLAASIGIVHARYGPGYSSLTIWDVKKWKSIQSTNFDNLVFYQAAISPDSRFLALASDYRVVHLWGIQEKIEITTLKGSDDTIRSVAFSPDGGVVIAASYKGSLFIWDVGSQTLLGSQQAHTKSVNEIIVRGNLLFSASDDGTIKIWNYRQNGRIQLPELPLYTLEGHESPVYSLTLSNDGKLLATASRDGMIFIWDLERRSIVCQVKAHERAVNMVRFSPTETRLLASCSNDSTIKLWKLL